MTKAEALQKTRERFTNLLDGKVLPNATVTSIINYYVRSSNLRVLYAR